MACPWKQVSGRRLPAFPGNSAHYNFGRRSQNGFERERQQRGSDFAIAGHGSEAGMQRSETAPPSCVNYVSARSSRSSQYKFEVANGPEQQLNKLIEALEERHKIPEALYKLANTIAKAVEADDVSLYTIGAHGNDMHLCREYQGSIQDILIGPVCRGTTLSAYVAETRHGVMVEDLLGDERFPQGIGVEGSPAKSALCLPLILPNGELTAVVELVRNFDNAPFPEAKFQIATVYLQWAGIALHKVQVCKGLTKQREFNDFLLDVSRVIFDDIVAMDTLTEHIMMFTKSLVNADRCALFLVDTTSGELYADLFDEGHEQNGKPVFSKKKQIRFSIEKGIAGHVARTGEIVNIPDAYNDPRFNREVDLATGYTTRSILCMPIMSHGSVIGVVQMINKKSGTLIQAFDKVDESNFSMFAVYCALALHYSKIYSSIQHSERLLAIARQQLDYYTSCHADEHQKYVARMHKRPVPVEEIERFDFDCRTNQREMCDMLIHMTQQLFGPDAFDLDTLVRFTIAVRKNYRPNPFHNFGHGFAVTQCMYSILVTIPGLFDDNEMQALFFSCLCHDMDHPAYTNSFQQKFSTPLAALYPASTLEHHHFNQTVRLLQQEGHNIFGHLPNNVYKQVLNYIQHNILQTDLALALSNQKELAKIVIANGVDLNNRNHRSKVHALMMTACDLNGTAKLWPEQRSTVDNLYSEFYSQGDEEKKLGCQPLDMMDRDKAHTLPQQQIGFLSNIAIPIFSVLADVLPSSLPLLEGCKTNLMQWQREAEGKTTDMWNVGSSRPPDSADK